MTKKRAAGKPNATDEVRKACEEIVAGIYAEVDRIEKERLGRQSSEMSGIQEAITDLSVRVAELERGPIRRLIRRLFGRR